MSIFEALSVIPVVGLTLVASAAADDTSATAEQTAHDHDGHDHAVEIGIAIGPAFIPTDREVAAGLHLHVVGIIGESRWGLGGGVERLFDSHGHTTISGLVQLWVLKGWSFVLGPGLTISDDAELQPSIHLETAYEFTVKRLHIGPVFEAALDPEMVHLTLGLHLGFGL